MLVFPVIEDLRDIGMIAKLGQHLGFPCSHGHPIGHDEIIGEYIEGHLSAADVIKRPVDLSC